MDNSIKIVTSMHGADKIMLVLHAMSFNLAEKRKFNFYLGKEVEKLARKRQSSQVDLEGNSWTPRSKNPTHLKTGKMLRKIVKPKNMVVYSDVEYATVTFKNSIVGNIAKKHQEGVQKKPGRAINKQHYDSPCTVQQAKALVREGYRRPVSGGNAQRVSIKYLTENMTTGQAGAILDKMQHGETSGSSKWFIPPRSFLGANSEEQQVMVKNIAQKIINRINARR